jgi:hypothetical protein
MNNKLKTFSMVFLTLFLLAIIPTTAYAAPPPDPFSIPDQIGGFGNLQVGDEFNYGLEFSQDLQDFYWDQYTQDLMFQLYLFLATGDIPQAHTWQDNVNAFLGSLDQARLNMQVTKIVQPNSTFVGRVAGLISLNNLDLEAIYRMFVGFQLINETSLPFNNWSSDVLGLVVDQPANLTTLTLVSEGLSGFNLPLIINNNWTYWGENVEFFNSVIPTGLGSSNHYFTVHQKTGLEAWYWNLIVNSSYLIDALLGSTLVWAFDNQSHYNWWVQKLGNTTIENWLHIDSGVTLELKTTLNMTGWLDAIEILIDRLYIITGEPILLVARNLIGSLTRPDDTYISFVMKDFRYGGIWILGGPGFYDLTFLWITLAIVIPVAIIIGIYTYRNRASQKVGRLVGKISIRKF